MFSDVLEVFAAPVMRAMKMETVSTSETSGITAQNQKIVIFTFLAAQRFD
jgi:hypothetical protein